MNERQEIMVIYRCRHWLRVICRHLALPSFFVNYCQNFINDN
jgi:hypothetical protein